MKKLLLIFFLSFLLLPNLTFSTFSEEYETIHVDDDNTDGPWDGTNLHPFQYIQDAINYANNNNFIYVQKGDYYENIIVNKSVFIYGVSANESIIHGDNYLSAVKIESSNSVLSRFTIENPNGSGIRICESANDVSISKNIIRNFSHVAISTLKHTHDHIIKNNIINICGKNSTGIICSQSEGVRIFSNNITNSQPPNRYDLIFGIDLAECRSCDVYNNSIYGMEKGIWANHIFSNEIQNNRIINSFTGISIWNSYENSVSNNYIEGDKEGYGISLMASSVFNQIDNNYITKKKTGIYAQNSFENIIFDNTLIDNFFDALTDTNNFKTNNWNHNYWSRTRVFPKIIFGTAVYGPTPNLIFFPWFEIDRNPAKEPFVISK